MIPKRKWTFPEPGEVSPGVRALADGHRPVPDPLGSPASARAPVRRPGGDFHHCNDCSDPGQQSLDSRSVFAAI